MFSFPPFSVALAGLESMFDPGAEGLRPAIAWARSIGARSVQLNAAAAGLRPRELERSGRRDIAAALKRSELGFSGLDLWIPPDHFVDGAQVDRAVSAVISAIEMAGEMGTLVGSGGPGSVTNVSITLARGKDGEVPAGVAAAIVAKGDACGVVVADYTYPWASGAVDARSPLGVGVDPAALLMAGVDPIGAVVGVGKRLKSVRLSDCQSVGRIGFGGDGGRVDALALAGALASAGYVGAAVLDLRGVRDPAGAAAIAAGAWTAPAVG